MDLTDKILRTSTYRDDSIVDLPLSEDANSAVNASFFRKIGIDRVIDQADILDCASWKSRPGRFGYTSEHT